MKKILITILSIFGICFSFCSADSWTATTTNFVNGELSTSNDNNLYFSNVLDGYNIKVNTLCFRFYGEFNGILYGNNPTYKIYLVYGLSGGTINYVYDYNLTCLDGNCDSNDTFNGQSNFCFDLGSGFLISSNEKLYYSYSVQRINSSYLLDSYNYFYDNFSSFSRVGVNRVSVGPFSVSVSGGIINMVSSPASTSRVGSRLISIDYDFIQSSPKFKVNYGNTSYEYELEDNLFIYLKSPTLQNGNTFTYVGNTGINLFYNGTSQWYSKSNLYLESMYWFNNNIFTPICL